MLPEPGDLVDGKYRVVRLIGEGGMGTVFEARHEVLGTTVALKFLHAELAENPALVARFLQEARVSATVLSPHVARVFDVEGAAGGGAYLVMELLSGEPLASRLERAHKLSRDEAIDIGLQVLSGLELAHSLGVVHRDLKPENVFITGGPGSLVKILDFGIAKLKQSAEFVGVVTRPGSMMGTPAYMAPEQAIAAEQVDERADIYSFGVLLYEMLTGARPVDGDEPSEIVERVMKGQIVHISERDPSLPRELVELVHQALSPWPERRPASAREVRMALAPLAGALSPAGRLAAALEPQDIALSSLSMPPPRVSTVPKTEPPEDSRPPSSVVFATPYAKTAAPDVVAPPRPPKTVPDVHRRSSSWPWWGWVAVTLLFAGAAAAYLLTGESSTRAGAPPFLPPPPELEPLSTELEPEPVPDRARKSAPRRRGTTPRETGEAPEPGGVPLPTFQIPSVLPPIPGLPTIFPPFGAAPTPSRAPATDERAPAPPSVSAPP